MKKLLFGCGFVCNDILPVSALGSENHILTWRKSWISQITSGSWNLFWKNLKVNIFSIVFCKNNAYY